MTQNTTAWLYHNVMRVNEADAIECAANLAFIGRWGEAEQQRGRGGYAGLGLIDRGAVASESEHSRENFRSMLDEDDQAV